MDPELCGENRRRGLGKGGDAKRDGGTAGGVGRKKEKPPIVPAFGPVGQRTRQAFQSELGDYYRAIGHRVPIIAISHHQASTATGVPIAAVIHHGVDVEYYQPGPGDGRERGPGDPADPRAEADARPAGGHRHVRPRSPLRDPLELAPEVPLRLPALTRILRQEPP